MVLPETVDRVLRAADELGYTLNRIAYALKTQRSLAVGVLIPDLQNPVFPPIIRGIEDYFSEREYTAIIANTDDTVDHEKSAIERLRYLTVDGLILATARREDPLVEACLRDRIPTVLVNRTVDNLDVDQVVTDELAGIRAAMNHLTSLGHRRIAHVSGPQDRSTGFARYRAFLHSIQELGLELKEDLLEVAELFTEVEGYAACLRLLARTQDFTAIVAGNDLLALGCIDALSEQGYACPGDVSVTGYNNMPMLHRMNPALTTVSIPHYDMGYQAARVVLQRIKKPGATTSTVLLKPQLVVRGSTASPKSKRRGRSPGSARR